MKTRGVAAALLVMIAVFSLSSCKVVRTYLREDMSSATFSYTHNGAPGRIDLEKNYCRAYDEKYYPLCAKIKWGFDLKPKLITDKSIVLNCFGGGQSKAEFKVWGSERKQYMCLITRVYNDGYVPVQNPTVTEVVPANFVISDVSASISLPVIVNTKDIVISKTAGAGGTTVYEARFLKPLNPRGSLYFCVTGRYLIPKKRTK